MNKFSGSISDPVSVKSINFSQVSTAISQASDISTGTYVLIKYEYANAKEIKSLSDELILKTSADLEINKYEIISPIYSINNSSISFENTVIFK